jgi:hypothetical protein
MSLGLIINRSVPCRKVTRIIPIVGESFQAICYEGLDVAKGVIDASEMPSIVDQRIGRHPGADMSLLRITERDREEHIQLLSGSTLQSVIARVTDTST